MNLCLIGPALDDEGGMKDAIRFINENNGIIRKRTD